MDHLRLLAAVQPAPVLDRALLTEGAVGTDGLRLRLSDAVLDRLVRVRAVGEDLSGPRADTRVGSLMTDGADGAKRWYVPGLALAEPDPHFAFAAVRQGADTDGRPFNVVHLALGLLVGEPADVTALRTADPGAVLVPVPLSDRAARLVVDARAGDGSTVTRRFPATLIEGSDGGLVLAADVLGPDALLLHAALTAAGGVRVEVDLGFDTVTLVAADPPVRPPRPRVPWRPRPWESRPVVVVPRPRVPQTEPQVVEALSPALRTLAVPTLALAPAPTASFGRRRVLQAETAFDTGDVLATELPEPVADPVVPDLPAEPAVDPADPIDPLVLVPGAVDAAPPLRALHQVVRETTVLDVGLRYAPTPYRPRYTLDVGDGTTRVVVDRDDLAEFGTAQSEFVELTTLGPVAARYPSLQALYLGRVTGTVVAVPAAYGLQRTAQGCAAAVDAVVDTSATSASGCRFHLTFGLLPLLDGSELIRLGADLAAEPTLRDRVTRVVLPHELAADPVTLAVRGADGLSAVEGADPGSFLVAFDLPDADVPAVVAVNLLLRQLSATPVPTLLGQLRLGLDDAFDQVLSTAVRLTLRDTTGGDDLRVTVGGDGSASVEDLSPFGLMVRGVVVQSGTAVVVRPAEVAVVPGTPSPLPVEPGDVVLAVDAELTEPDGGFDAHLQDYVSTTVATVQQVRHTVGVNAAGLLSAQVDRVTVSIVLDRDPSVALPPIVLADRTAVQHTVWQLPVLSTLGGLPATLTVSVHRVDGSETSTTLSHDFALEPVLTLTSDLGR